MNEKLDKWLASCNNSQQYLDLSEPFSMSRYPVIHHCFLPEHELEQRGLTSEVYDDLLHQLSEELVCWYYSGYNNTQACERYKILGSRVAMLRNLARLEGLAIFIGDLSSDGLATEYQLALENIARGLTVIHIP